MDKKINQLVGEITSLAVFLTMNTDMAVFIDFAAHVEVLDVRIYEQGWEKNVLPTDVLQVKLKHSSSAKELREIKKILKEYIDKKIFDIGGIRK